MKQLDYKKGRAVFSTRSVQRCYKQGTRLDMGQVGMAWEREAEESVRSRCQGTTDEDTEGEKMLSRFSGDLKKNVDISNSAVIACSSESCLLSGQ
jgi:hypothetical protein